MGQKLNEYVFSISPHTINEALDSQLKNVSLMSAGGGSIDWIIKAKSKADAYKQVLSIVKDDLGMAKLEEDDENG